MDRVIVPVLKSGGRVRVIEENHNKANDNDNDNKNKSENEREERKKIKEMQDMGEPQLFGYKNPYPLNYEYLPEKQRKSQTRRSIYDEPQYRFQNIPHHEFQQQEQNRKVTQHREQSRRSSASDTVSQEYLLPKGDKNGRKTSSNIKDHYALTGSAYLPNETKFKFTTEETSSMMKDLKEAQETDSCKVWPVYEDGAMSDRREKKKTTVSMEESAIVVPEFKSKQKAKVKIKTEESAILTPIYEGADKQRREELKNEWKAKGERDIAGRPRIPGGYEDVLENDKLKSLDPFKKPTLLDVDVEKYQRGQDTDKEDGGDEWRRIRRSEKGGLVAKWGDGFKQQKGQWKDRLVKEEIARKRERTKHDARRTMYSDSSNGSTTRSDSQAGRDKQYASNELRNKVSATNFGRADESHAKNNSRSSSNSSQDSAMAATRSQAERQRGGNDESTGKPAIRKFSFARSYDSRNSRKSQHNVLSDSGSEQKQPISNKPRIKHAARSDSPAMNDARTNYFSRSRKSSPGGIAMESKLQAEQEQKQESSDKLTGKVAGDFFDSVPIVGPGRGYRPSKHFTTKSDSKRKEGSTNLLQFGDAAVSDSSTESDARPRDRPRSGRHTQEEATATSKSQAEHGEQQESSDQPHIVRRRTYTSSFTHRRKSEAGSAADSKS